MKKFLVIFIIATLLLTGSSCAIGIKKTDLQQNPAVEQEATTQAPAAESRLQDSIVLYNGSPVAMVNEKTCTIEPGNLKIRPIEKNGSLLVPVRFITEGLGGTVSWNGTSQKAVLRFEKTVIGLIPGSKTMDINGKKTNLDAQVWSENGRLYVVAAQLAEGIGYHVFAENGLVAISKNNALFDRSKDKTEIDGLIKTLAQPPAVGTQEAFNAVLRQVFSDWSKLNRSNMKKSRDLLIGNAASNKVTGMSENAGADSPSPADSASTGAKNDFSGTNVQVEGVDEGDLVKTDGTYIYQVVQNRIVLTRAAPANQMKVEGMVDFSREDFIPAELYIEGNRLVVIGSSRMTDVNIDKSNTSKSMRYYVQPQYTKVMVYDCKDKSNIVKVREAELDGSYVTSRKIGSRLFMVANKDISRYYYNGWEKETELRPSIKDSAAGNDVKYIDYSKITCFPESMEPSFLIVASLDIKADSQAAEVYTCLGSGENVYVSADNLYAVFSEYSTINSEINTVIYKFSLQDGKAAFACKGSVKGTVLNQFSMDEYAGGFRIATTSGDMRRNDEGTSKNNLYVLDEVLKQTGSLENLAPGEKIYSVRYMGDRAYVVTYKTVDPLFVIDLKDKTAPKVLGALKIPGYSDYLHPYDNNHIIGFGKDTVEIKGNAYYQGMKLALFDVTDVANPVQLFTEKIGDRGTDSELLRNHKALLFSKEKGLLAFPVTVMKVDQGQKAKNELEYGNFTFQGAYVYQIDLTKGFTLKGLITHLTEADYQKSGNSWYDSEKNVERILYINNTVYTLSQAKIKANSLSDMKEEGEVALP